MNICINTISLNTYSGLDSGVKLDISSDVGTIETNKQNVTMTFSSGTVM